MQSEAKSRRPLLPKLYHIGMLVCACLIFRLSLSGQFATIRKVTNKKLLSVSVGLFSFFLKFDHSGFVCLFVFIYFSIFHAILSNFFVLNFMQRGGGECFLLLFFCSFVHLSSVKSNHVIYMITPGSKIQSCGGVVVVKRSAAGGVPSSGVE